MVRGGEEGYTQCSQFLYGKGGGGGRRVTPSAPSSSMEKMGIMNRGVVYGLWDYSGADEDELAFGESDSMTVVRREDEDEVEWWWVCMGETLGYAPRNLLGVRTTHTHTHTPSYGV
ncbi:hypothetical protein NHX12_022868 [Muraenolepis orangiensis]|uniref:SH3 domain-containing protein n=1 Tax=Muraenolepis orangiensis TaxID=630683 RepID=A0A9Q0ENV8_9TELE|nr:hypothetical protein NHX12_022868 [Muraenolepis orangiensis]